MNNEIKRLEASINEINKSLKALNRESLDVRLRRIEETCKAYGWSLTEIISK